MEVIAILDEGLSRTFTLLNGAKAQVIISPEEDSMELVEFPDNRIEWTPGIKCIEHIGSRNSGWARIHLTDGSVVEANDQNQVDEYQLMLKASNDMVREYAERRRDYIKSRSNAEAAEKEYDRIIWSQGTDVTRPASSIGHSASPNDRDLSYMTFE